MKYKVNEDQKKFFAGIYILDYMINAPKKFPLYLEGNDADLEPVLEWLLIKEFVKIENKEFYSPTEQGKTKLKDFLLRYTEFIKIFDIFCAVDLEEGEFAFSYVDNFGSDNSGWKQFLKDERWDDLRVAVAEFKKINPIEIVFMSFINENRFGRNSEGWQFDLLLGTVWDEILNICNSAIHIEDLGYQEGSDVISGEDVITDIVTQGSAIMIDINKSIDEEIQAELNCEYEDRDDIEAPEFILEERIVYESYYDPFYISPFWCLIYW